MPVLLWWRWWWPPFKVISHAYHSEARLFQLRVCLRCFCLRMLMKLESVLRIILFFIHTLEAKCQSLIIQVYFTPFLSCSISRYSFFTAVLSFLMPPFLRTLWSYCPSCVLLTPAHFSAHLPLIISAGATTSLAVLTISPDVFLGPTSW